MGTTAHGIEYPDSTDHTRLWEHFQTLADDVDALMFPVFADNTARDAAIPSPSAGRRCYVTGTGEDLIYRGSAWVSASPRTAFKTAAEDVTSSTTLQSDDHLLFSVEANSRYYISGPIWIAPTSATPDIKVSMQGPTGSTMDWHLAGGDIGASPGTGPDVADWVAYVAMGATTGSTKRRGTNGSSGFIGLLHCTIKTAATAGTWNLRWAQDTSNATATRLAENSVLNCWKIS